MAASWFVIKTVLAGLVISLSSWLAGRRPDLAGFLVALPLVSVIAIVMSYIEHGDNEKTTLFAKSIFVGVPLSLVFFAPFLVQNYTRLPFWLNLILGLALLLAAYLIHSKIVG